MEINHTIPFLTFTVRASRKTTDIVRLFTLLYHNLQVKKQNIHPRLQKHYLHSAEHHTLPRNLGPS